MNKFIPIIFIILLHTFFSLSCSSSGSTSGLPDGDKDTADVVFPDGDVSDGDTGDHDSDGDTSIDGDTDPDTDIDGDNDIIENGDSDPDIVLTGKIMRNPYISPISGTTSSSNFSARFTISTQPMAPKASSHSFRANNSPIQSSVTAP